MKKIFLATALCVFFSGIPHALAAGSGFTALAPIPGLTNMGPTAVVDSTSLANFFNNLYKYLIGLAAVLAVIEIIWAGLGIAYFHKDAVAAITDDKGKIRNALLGLVLVLSPALVFTIINPSILNLSLNLPKLNTTTGTAGNNTGAGGTPAQSNVANCSAVSPVQGVVLATCTASDSGGQPDAQMISAAQSSAQQFASTNTNCVGNNIVGASMTGSCTNHITTNSAVGNTSNGNIVVTPQTTSCTSATAYAYCSQIVSVNIVQIPTGVSTVGTGLGGANVSATYTKTYFGDNAAFANACANAGTLLAAVKSARLRPLFTTAPGRMAELPQLQNASEAGMRDLGNLLGWTVLLGPRGMSEQRVADWKRALQQLAKDPAWRAGTLARGGIPPEWTILPSITTPGVDITP